MSAGHPKYSGPEFRALLRSRRRRRELQKMNTEDEETNTSTSSSGDVSSSVDDDKKIGRVRTTFDFSNDCTTSDSSDSD